MILGLAKRVIIHRFEEGPEIGYLSWQDEGLREKVEFFRKLSFHLQQVLGQFIFVSNALNAWPLRYPLKWLDPVENIGGYG